RLFYARRFNGEAMQGLTVLDFSQGALDQIVLARSAQWVPEENAWLFEDGTNYIVDADGTYRNILQFDRQEIALSRAPLDLASTVRDADEMNIRELKRYIDVIQTSGDEQEVRKLRVRLYEKYSIPFVCLTFALVGAPLGLRPQRTSSSIGLGLSVLIIFGYYLAMFISQAMGQVGALGPAVAAWLPNAIGFAVGGVLVYRASQA
ncbi:MAG: LptF/LptG family permease, partial [Cyanobacteria bacterium J06648_11]